MSDVHISLYSNPWRIKFCHGLFLKKMQEKTTLRFLLRVGGGRVVSKVDLGLGVNVEVCGIAVCSFHAALGLELIVVLKNVTDPINLGSRGQQKLEFFKRYFNHPVSPFCPLNQVVDLRIQSCCIHFFFLTSSRSTVWV